MQLAGEILPVGCGPVNMDAAQPRPDKRVAEEVDQVRQERHVLPIADLLARIAVLEFVLDQGGGQGMRLLHGGLQP